MNLTPLDHQTQKNFHFNHETIKKMDGFIMTMKPDVWFKIREDETKLAVVKDWIYKDLLQPYYLTLSNDYKSFIKRKSQQ